MSIRKLGVMLAFMCAALLIVPVAAGAKTVNVKTFQNVPVTGTVNGKALNGHFAIDHFTHRGGRTLAVGRLTGHYGNKSFSRSSVAIPVTYGSTTHGTRVPRQAAPSCSILNLTLGPLDLHLLGLNVHLNQVVLNITATPGPGNLLGNLLCDVANLLNQSPTGGLSGLLNALSTILNNL